MNSSVHATPEFWTLFNLKPVQGTTVHILLLLNLIKFFFNVTGKSTCEFNSQVSEQYLHNIDSVGMYSCLLLV